jgi:Tol biopolymer transport system component
MRRLSAILFVFLFFLSGCLSPNLTQQPASPVPSQPEPTQVPQSQGDQSQPDATGVHWLALFGSDGNAWLVDPRSGEKKQITKDGTPQAQASAAEQRISYCCFSWSSDGKLLAFRRITQNDTASGTETRFSLWVYDEVRDQANAMLQDVRISGLAFQPGTHWLAYSQPLDPDYFTKDGPDASKATGIMGLNVDTGETRELVKPEKGLSLAAPRWSPDGQVLGFTEQTIFQGPVPFAIYDFKNKVYLAWNQVIGGYSFAPDGQHIAYDRLAYTTGNERIWISDIWSKGEQELSPSDGPLAHGPSWSPKGDLLAYLLGDPSNAENVLAVQPVAGGELHKLGSFALPGPLAWSPDGTQLAFSTNQNNQSMIKVVMVADGLVKDLGAGYDPNWQP